MSVIDAIIAKKLCGGGGGGGGSVPKPLTYDYMPEGYPSKSVQTTVLMEEQECAFTYDGKSAKYYLTDPLDLVEGQTYTVKWDGTEYECVCGKMGVVLFVGNLRYANMGEDSGEPFLYDTHNNVFTTFDASPSHTISVKTTEEVVTPMAEEFLPSGVTAAIENAQTTAEKNKEVLAGAFSSVATFTFDKQTSGRDTFRFNAFSYYKISDFNPSPSDVISFKVLNEFGDESSKIKIGTNCAQYGEVFIIVASAGVCSLPLIHTVGSFTAPSTGLYARYEENNAHMTAGTGEFTLMSYGLTIKSSTYGSTKIFKITVDDSGTISATEVT